MQSFLSLTPPAVDRCLSFDSFWGGNISQLHAPHWRSQNQVGSTCL